MISADDASRQASPAVVSTALPSHSLRHHGNSHNIRTTFTSSSGARSSSTSSSLETVHHKLSSSAAMDQHIFIVTGPAGCGKTTVAKGLAKELSLPYIEGDDYHSLNNKSKMASGVPLTDDDRWDWLVSLRREAVHTLSSPATGNDTNTHGTPPHGVVVTCSALKAKYRDVIRAASSSSASAAEPNADSLQQGHAHVHVHFIYLRADEQTLLHRVTERQGHYMKSNMVQSQLAMLEEPGPEEQDVLVVDCAAEPEVVQVRASEAVKNKLTEYR